MAFKRSAVRSRLSPPSQRDCERKPHFFGSGVFALCGDGNDVHAHAELLIRGCGRKVGQSRGRKEEVGILFTYEKKVRALQLYEQTHSVTETIRFQMVSSGLQYL